ncbi:MULTISPECIES: toxin-antitoxin system YwqK family antitoxin [unclassified Frankia]|uniref:toxin-antitoxin system YwqK family antitoxin n=1 Tax=unclassified Frankia TaxID=2632575 RepID=UPI001EF65F75|nr:MULTISPECIES: hypothetical protein [unclassified Frankia]
MSGSDESGVARVEDSELDFDEDLIYTYRGVLFTGIGYEEVPGHGFSEISYRQGMQAGPARDWYPSGALKGESYFWENVLHGPLREFDEDGNVQFEAVYEYGILVSSLRSDASGAVVESSEISDESPNFSLLERYRRERAWPAREE